MSVFKIFFYKSIYLVIVVDILDIDFLYLSYISLRKTGWLYIKDLS